MTQSDTILFINEDVFDTPYRFFFVNAICRMYPEGRVEGSDKTLGNFFSFALIIDNGRDNHRDP